MADETVATFDPNSLADKLRERIRNSIGELIPDAYWDQMMKTEITRFFSSETARSYYSETRVIPSGFTEVAQKMLADDARKRIEAYFSSGEWQQRWDRGDDTIPARLETLVQENLPLLMRECVMLLLGRISRNAADSVERAMQQRLNS